MHIHQNSQKSKTTSDAHGVRVTPECQLPDVKMLSVDCGNWLGLSEQAGPCGCAEDVIPLYSLDF